MRASDRPSAFDIDAGPARRVRAWADLARHYHTFGPRMAPMEAVVRALASAPEARGLCAAVERGALLLARTDRFAWADGVLRVACAEGRVRLRFRRGAEARDAWVRAAPGEQGAAAVLGAVRELRRGPWAGDLAARHRA